MGYLLTHIYLAAFVVTTVAATGVTVLAPAQPAKRSIVAVMVCAALWTLSDFLSNLATTPAQLQRVGQVFAFAWPPLGLFVLRAGMAYAGHQRLLRSWPLTALLALPAAVCTFLVLSGRLHLAHIPATVNGAFFQLTTSPWQHLVTAYFLVYTCASGLLLLRARRRTASPEFDGPVRVILFASLPVALVGGAMNGGLSLAGLSTPFMASLAIDGVVVYVAVKMLRSGYFRPHLELDQTRELLSRREQVLDGLPLGVAIVAREGGELLFCNSQYRSLVGEGEQVPDWLARYLEQQADTTAESEEVELPPRGQSQRSLRVHAVPLLYSRTQVVLFALLDISERKQLEAQLQESQKWEAIGTLAGGVAHDINNILAVIMNNAAVLQLERPEDEGAGEVMNHVLAACRRGRDLTRNLLGFARRGSYLSEPVDLNWTVSEVATLLQRTVSKQITFVTQLTPQLPLVTGDPAQLHQALMNICLNAVEAMPHGGELSLATLERGGRVRVQVTDTGCGMDDETLRRCQEPLFTTRPAGQGTGLGLPMVVGTMANHRGELSVESAPGQGTTVTLDLPAAAVSPAAHQPARPTGAPVDREGVVLVVDDEPMIREAGKRLLESLGFSALVAGGGEEALALLEQHDGVGVVILDLVMPGMDGAAAFAAVRARRPDLPVLLASGYSKDRVARELIARGAAGFLQKPFEVDELEAALGQVLQRSPRRA